MASFAKIGLNGEVIEVLSVNNEVLKDTDGVEQEINGINFLKEIIGDFNWKQTSYNTYNGTHKLGGTPFRRNFASIDYTYYEDIDCFIPPKPYDSWTLNKDTFQWESPIPVPQDDNSYIWNESNKTWDKI
jgi:hypothetical protein